MARRARAATRQFQAEALVVLWQGTAPTTQTTTQASPGPTHRLSDNPTVRGTRSFDADEFATTRCRSLASECQSCRRTTPSAAHDPRQPERDFRQENQHEQAQYLDEHELEHALVDRP